LKEEKEKNSCTQGIQQSFEGQKN
jgi:hypothetical protein